MSDTADFRISIMGHSHSDFYVYRQQYGGKLPLDVEEQYKLYKTTIFVFVSKLCSLEIFPGTREESLLIRTCSINYF